MARARDILADARTHSHHDWKVFLEGVLLERRAGNRDQAVRERLCAVFRVPSQFSSPALSSLLSLSLSLSLSLLSVDVIFRRSSSWERRFRCTSEQGGCGRCVDVHGPAR